MTTPVPETKPSRRKNRQVSPIAGFHAVRTGQSAEEAEAEAILARIDSELTVEEALTRQLMIRHGL